MVRIHHLPPPFTPAGLLIFVVFGRFFVFRWIWAESLGAVFYGVTHASLGNSVCRLFFRSGSLERIQFLLRFDDRLFKLLHFGNGAIKKHSVAGHDCHAGTPCKRCQGD
jgi:hypothetical protein